MVKVALTFMSIYFLSFFISKMMDIEEVFYVGMTIAPLFASILAGDICIKNGSGYIQATLFLIAIFVISNTALSVFEKQVESYAVYILGMTVFQIIFLLFLPFGAKK